PDCPRCSSTILPGPAYAYLLGLYLGDGCLTTLPKGLYRLEITLDARYAMVIFEAALAMSGMRPSAWRPVGQRPRPGCVVLSSVWKHWPCLFPQHGPGRKHERKIEFATWQQSIINRHPEYLLRGLLQSDGSRFLNRVKRQAYARYQFTNLSDDIREIFCRACDDFGVAWRTMNAKSISIARRADVVRLDTVVGPKR